MAQKSGRVVPKVKKKYETDYCRMMLRSRDRLNRSEKIQKLCHHHLIGRINVMSEHLAGKYNEISIIAFLGDILVNIYLCFELYFCHRFN